MFGYTKAQKLIVIVSTSIKTLIQVALKGDKLNKTPSYGRNSNWNEGNVFMIRRTVKDSTLGDEFELVYKDLNDDEIKEIGYIN